MCMHMPKNVSIMGLVLTLSWYCLVGPLLVPVLMPDRPCCVTGRSATATGVWSPIP